MADSLSDADKIRNKRLAKLGSASSGQSKAEESTKDESSSSDATRADVVSPHPIEQPKPRISISNPSSDPNPFSQLGMKQTSSDPPKINITSQKPLTPQKREADGRPSSRSGESLEAWEDRHLSSIFRTSLTSGNKDSHGHSLYYLAGTRAELDESNQPLRLSTSLLDQALLEAASNVEKRSTPLNYLLECWKRVSRQYKALRKHGEEDPKFRIIKEARRLCMSYCIFAASMPEMFGLESASSNQLAPYLLIDSDEDHGIDHDFMTEAISRFLEDDSVKDVLVGAMEDLSQHLAKKTMNDDYKPYVNALRLFIQYPPLVNALVQSPRFLPPTLSAQQFEHATLLGPFFALSPLQAEVNRNYFSAPSTRDQGYIINSQKALRMTLQSHQMDLLDITNRIIKTGKEPRERMLDWFARSCNLNHKRRAIQVDENAVSSDGLMINITVCLDQLCEPFMDASFSKIDRIEADYLRRKPRVDIKEETKINADQMASDEFYGKPAEGANNFISEVFFLTLAAHHYGTEAANAALSQLEKDIKRMKKHLDEVELDRHKLLDDPQRLRMFDATLKKWKDQVERGLCRKHALQGVLLDEQAQGRSMQFMRYVIVWLLRLVAPNRDYPKQPMKLPLPEDAPKTFKCLPEYFLEDVVSNFKFITRNLHHIITTTQSDELIILCITFLRNSQYIKNPHLKAGLITIMFTGVWPTHHRPKGILGDQLTGMNFANKHLLHSLIKFYIEIESTGAHTQFYDKFNVRYEIFQIIKCIWSNSLYREHLSEEADENAQFFIRFVNLLLNDVTFVLDESLSGFKQIHDLTIELRIEGENMQQDRRAEKEEALSAVKGKTKGYMQLTNETVAMLKLFTEALANAFTMPEIVQRLADMLDYNLETLVGPKSRDLIVENKEEYDFQPKTLLSEMVDVYLNLRNQNNFIEAVARDGRSYKPRNFDSAASILQNYALKSQGEIKAWTALGERIKKQKEVDDQAEEDLGEIPGEFEDPLMATFMRDPIILPSSRQTVDRSTIQAHLLSDPSDPFNRVPLKIEEVIPDTQLLGKINAWVAKKKAQKLEALSKMDTTPG